MQYGSKEYSATITAVKAVIDFLKVMGWGGAATATAVSLHDQIPAEWSTFSTYWPMFVAAVAAAIAKAFSNYFKHNA